MQRLRQRVQNRPTAAFVVLAFLVSWGAWVLLLAAEQGWLQMRPWSGWHLLGGLGPAVAAVVVVGCTEGRAGLRRLGRRLVAWRGRRRAWAFALLVPPLLLVVAAPLSAWLSGISGVGLNRLAFGASTELVVVTPGMRKYRDGAARLPHVRHRCHAANQGETRDQDRGPRRSHRP